MAYTPIKADIAQHELGVSPYVKNALLRSVQDRNDFSYVCDFEMQSMIDAFRRWLDAQYPHLSNTSNSIHAYANVYAAIASIIEATTRPDSKVGVVKPDYFNFSRIANELGRQVQVIGELGDDGILRSDRHTEADLECILVSDPNNPTGVFPCDLFYENIAQRYLVADGILIRDRVNYPLFHSKPSDSIPAHLRSRTVDIYSATKAWNISGLQMALSVSYVQTKDLFKSKRIFTGSPNLLGVIAARAAWQDPSPWLAEVRRTLAQRVVRLNTTLANCNVTMTTPRAGCTIWLRSNSEASRQDIVFYDHLQREGISALPGTKFGFTSDAVRISIGQHNDEFEGLVERLFNCAKGLQ